MMESGFIDIHTHGAIGIDVNEASVEDLYQLSEFFRERGVHGWMPTVMTDSEERMQRAVRTIAEAKRSQRSGAAIMGIHLEGPFLSPVYSGAMPTELLREGDPALIERLQRSADGAIRIITVAPEVNGVTTVIKAFSDTIAFSLGHSNATYQEGMDAIAAGAVSITHFCNAMRLFHMHEPGLMGAALESDVWCEIIGDGIHLVPSTVRVLLKAKGREKLMVVTDSMSAAGQSDGEYLLGGNKVTVKSGDAKLSGTSVRAGSVLTMDRAFENMKKFTNLADDEILPMFGANQLAMLNATI
jgi:N-acetylglucosamine-6-phosphate deacetylase